MTAKEAMLQQPSLSNSFAKKHLSTAAIGYKINGKRCFLCCPCQDIISRTNLEFPSEQYTQSSRNNISANHDSSMGPSQKTVMTITKIVLNLVKQNGR
jgi:hypothetical protein